jgi:hypothetical protein
MARRDEAKGRLTRLTPGVGWALVPCLSLFAAAGCGETAASASGGGGGGGHDRGEQGGEAAVETGCGDGDVTCPDDRPFAGSPCEGDLVCEYVEDGGKTVWTTTCIDGKWDLYASCEVLPEGCQLIPPPAEACDEPFQGSLDATVEVGPASEETFRSFTDGEPIEIVWGAQGSAMMFYRIKLTGPELPTCIGTTVSFDSPAFVEAIPGHGTVVLRCGQSLSMFTIIPYGECVMGEEHFDATFRLAVDGVGEVAQPLRIPYAALCGFGS